MRSGTGLRDCLALHGMLGEASDWKGYRGADLWQWDCDLDGAEIGAGVVIGYSMGGRLALHALDQVEGAVIVSAHTGLTEGREQRLADDLDWAEKARTLPWAEFLAQWHAQPVFAGGSFEPDRTGLEARRGRIAAAFDRWSLGRQEDLLPSLAAVDIPVLWVNGARDEKFCRIGERACEVLARGEHLVIGGCGHRVPWERPADFALSIKEFLSRHSLCR